MPRGIPNTNSAEINHQSAQAASLNSFIEMKEKEVAPPPPTDADLSESSMHQPIPPAPPVVMIPMKLERNYRPAGNFEIVGHTRPEVKRKAPDGRETIVQREEWIDGEAMPGAIPGAGFKEKIWAGTVLRVAKDEALNIQRARIGVPHLA